MISALSAAASSALETKEAKAKAEGPEDPGVAFITKKEGRRCHRLILLKVGILRNTRHKKGYFELL